MTPTERDAYALRLLEKAKRFAKLLPEGYRVCGVDPGALFVSNDARKSLDVTEEILDSILSHVAQPIRAPKKLRRRSS